MSYLIIGILVLILVVMATRYLLIRQDLSKITQQLNYLKQDITSNQYIRTETQQKETQKLITAINHTLEIQRAEVRSYKRQQLHLNQEITNISHDLRTPLTAIKGYVNLLKTQEIQDNPDKYLKIINDKTDALIHAVDLFHEITRLDSRDYPLNIVTIHINEIVQEQFLLYFYQFQAHNIKITFDETSVSPIKGDIKILERIFANVIQNLLKYSKTYAHIHFYERDRNVEVLIVNDTDELLNEGKQTHIFQRSYTLDMSRSNGSMGLGLYVVQRLMHTQKGRVTANMKNHQFQLSLQFSKDYS
ncbi:HAMP domain-containing histidine kinase [Staphylococcus ursi]|uniref:sensor histidine kinase n=1 Tax=Staphylococcus sp. MI 10-1553 TaxID=1912064 RepID=UPI001397C431|nr:HAMP domain-containing sensor histidine kinase [Staphylococcus sp. MI 10-1553]QHW35977.1 HAMP domain-containing histidine kinase [Staphylococcus sp. MI 10-1553]